MENKNFATFADAVGYIGKIVEEEIGKDAEEVYNFYTFASQAMKDRVFEDERAKMDSKFFIIITPHKVFYSEDFNYALEIADSCPKFKYVVKVANKYGKGGYVEFINYKGKEKR